MRRGGFFGPLGAFDHEMCNNAMSYNVFFTQNQLPASGCFTVAWSLAVQMQFWFIFPLVLLLRPQTPGFRYLPQCSLRLKFNRIFTALCCTRNRLDWHCKIRVSSKRRCHFQEASSADFPDHNCSCAGISGVAGEQGFLIGTHGFLCAFIRKYRYS